MLRGGLSAALGVLVAIPTAFAAPTAFSPADRDQLAIYARDTWRSLDALAGTGALPSDNLEKTPTGWKPAEYTSPTNVAAYLWSTVAAEELKLISREEAGERIGKTLVALGRIERAHGFFYNWYDPRTGDRLACWPGGDAPIRPFLSSVDNGWLAAALMTVANVRPELRAAAEAILAPMNFRFFYDEYDASDPAAHPGLLRGGYYPQEGKYTRYHYGMLNTEPRIASYVGITRGDLPPDHYYRMTRYNRGENPPIRTYLGVAVTQGTREYRGLKLIPSWDGTMFEALMVPLFVPEATWGEASWGANHLAYAKAQMEYGLNDAKLGYWGVSASSDPDNGYQAFGVAAIAAARKVKSDTRVVTPHASFLALAFTPREAMDNLRDLAANFKVYGDYGFLDAVDVRDGRVSQNVLTLDQGMVLAAIANALGDNVLQNAFSTGPVESMIRPLIAQERFGGQAEVLAIRTSDPETPTRRADVPERVPPTAFLGSAAVLEAASSTTPPKRRRRTGPPAKSV